MTDRPRFISFEGGEGAGKSTQAGLLAAWLRSIGQPVVVTREPGGSSGAERIRDLLLAAPTPYEADGSANAGGFDGLTEGLLHTAARRDHCLKVINPALESGAFVITDRFIDSTVAYQGYGLGVPVDTLIELQAMAVPHATRPTLTILLDIAVEAGLSRARERKGVGPADEDDRYEREAVDFHQRIRAGFRELSDREPGRIVTVNADQGVDDVHAIIRHFVRRRFDLP